MATANAVINAKSAALACYQRVWLVGASYGIGAALVDELDQVGRTLYISARSQNLLEQRAQAAKGEVIPIAMDMTDATQVAKALEQIGAQGGLDLVVLNAGTCEYMDSDYLDMALLGRVMQSNFFGVTGLMNPALELLRSSSLYRAGPTQHASAPKLVVLSSSVSYQALPRAHAYGASKAALRYFCECLKADVQKEGIDVRVVSPGFVKTPLTDQNDFDMPARISAQEAASRIVSGLATARFDISFPKRFTWGLKLFASLPNIIKFKLLSAMSRHQVPVAARSKD